ncbi:hypothetical protein SCB29_07450 [Paraburkholderia sp. SIMBA_055]|jgi:hypothetical protein|uniref:hypothetical protein n=1 Tax=Paraburkholderia graminis TaxID=60548 RepID=UPI0005C71F3C|nr:hypothetical protein [Paraburkholderia graminis]
MYPNLYLTQNIAPVRSSWIGPRSPAFRPRFAISRRAASIYLYRTVYAALRDTQHCNTPLRRHKPDTRRDSNLINDGFEATPDVAMRTSPLFGKPR